MPPRALPGQPQSYPGQPQPPCQTCESITKDGSWCEHWQRPITDIITNKNATKIIRKCYSPLFAEDEMLQEDFSDDSDDDFHEEPVIAPLITPQNAKPKQKENRRQEIYGAPPGGSYTSKNKPMFEDPRFPQHQTSGNKQNNVLNFDRFATPDTKKIEQKRNFPINKIITIISILTIGILLVFYLVLAAGVFINGQTVVKPTDLPIPLTLFIVIGFIAMLWKAISLIRDCRAAGVNVI